MRLNSAAHRPTSSRPRSGTRADRSPPAMRRAARPASATGRRSQRAMTHAVSSATPIATAPPASSPDRSWASAACTGSAGNTKNRSGGPPCRPPTTRTGSPARSCQAKPSSPAVHDGPQLGRDRRQRPAQVGRLVRRAIAEVGQHATGAPKREGRREARSPRTCGRRSGEGPRPGAARTGCSPPAAERRRGAGRAARRRRTRRPRGRSRPR